MLHAITNIAVFFFIYLDDLPTVSEVIFVITSAVKDVCGKPPTERLFLDKYGRICLCLDEIVWKVRYEHLREQNIEDFSVFFILHHSPKFKE